MLRIDFGVLGLAVMGLCADLGNAPSVFGDSPTEAWTAEMAQVQLGPVHPPSMLGCVIAVELGG